MFQPNILRVDMYDFVPNDHMCVRVCVGGGGGVRVCASAHY